MKIKYLLITFLMVASVTASALSPRAEWFVRGTQNSWSVTPMIPSGTNTVEVKNVVFTSPGSVKFDRFGDWRENYGIGGGNGGNIAVAKGTWNIKFYTDTKHWNISPVVQYHLRGTHNGWAEGDLFPAPVSGTAGRSEVCRNFGTAKTNGATRFKVDPNGGWGWDAFPSQDYVVSGWTKIIIDGAARKVISVNTDLNANCTESLIFTTPGPINVRVSETFDNPVKNALPQANIIYQSSDPTVATVVGSTVKIIRTGTVTITAVDVNSDDAMCMGLMCAYGGSYVINAYPSISSLQFTGSVPNNLVVGDQFDNPAQGSPASGFIGYFSSNSDVAVVSGSKVTIVGPGTATIRAAESEVGSCLCGGDARYMITATQSTSSAANSSSSSSNTNVVMGNF